jgi:hypothetical protein
MELLRRKEISKSTRQYIQQVRTVSPCPNFKWGATKSRRLVWCVAGGVVAYLLWGCSHELRPLASGTRHVENATHGLVFGRIKVIPESHDHMANLPAYELGWWLTRQESGERFVVMPLTKDGAFVLNLSEGTYQVTRLFYHGNGVWDGSIPANFTVAPGHVTYLGTWVLRFDTDRTARAAVKAEVIDELPIAERELGYVYLGPSKPVRVALLTSQPEGYFSRWTPGTD